MLVVVMRVTQATGLPVAMTSTDGRFPIAHGPPVVAQHVTNDTSPAISLRHASCRPMHMTPPPLPFWGGFARRGQLVGLH